jgi:LmbE family N-acetylglucosaminyl deacetylase
MYASRPSWVVTLTAGDRGRADPDVRVWDSLRVPQLGRVPAEQCLNLAYPDGRLRDMYLHQDRVFQLACEQRLPRRDLRARNRASDFDDGGPDCDWDGLVRELRALILKIKPAAVVSPHPLVDSTFDHIFTTVALENAVRKAGAAGPLYLLYAVEPRGASPLHPFGPADTVASVPAWADPEWIADSIYSHPLSAELRREKIAAVDAAHDLRAPAGGTRDARRAVAALIAGMPRDPLAFQRRAPRPNEIYFVASAASLSSLVERALKPHRPCS